MSFQRRGWLAVAVVAGMAAPLVAQAPPAFEVASVKRAEPGKTGGRVRFLPGGRFVGENVALQFVIQQVYGLRDFQVIAAPPLRAIIKDGYGARYEIEGKGEDTPSNSGRWSTPGCHPSFQEMVKRSSRYAMGATASCPSIFTAVREQLGLRLDAQVGPVDVLVIDSVRYPTDN